MTTCRDQAAPHASIMALLVIAFILGFSPLVEGGTTHLAVMVIRLQILFLLALFFWKSLLKRQLELPLLPIGMPVKVFLALAVGSVMFSKYFNQSWQWLLVLTSYALLLYLITAFVTEWEQIRNLVAVIIIVGLGEAAWTLWQGVIWQIPRPHGTFFNPNFLAGYLCVSSTILIGLLVCSGVTWRGVGSPTGFHPMMIAGIVAMLFILINALLWTGSRGGLMAMMAGTGSVLALRFGPWRGAAVVAMIFTCLLLVPNPIRERTFKEHTANTESYARLQMWQRSIEQMADHPLGIGLGLYQYTYPRYAFPVEGQIARYGKIAQTPHNEYLQIGVELGVVAMAVCLWGVVRAGKHVRFLLSQRLRHWQRGVVIGVSGGVASVLAHAAFDSNLHEPAIAILLAVCVGLLFAVPPKANLKTVVPLRSRPLWAVLATTLVLVLGLEVLRLGIAWSAYETGTRHSSKNDAPAALSSFLFAAALDPGKALYHHALAMQYAAQYEQTEDHEAAHAAVRELEVATGLNPLDGRLYARLGALYFQWSHSSRAVLALEQRRTLQISSLHAYRRASELAPFVASYRFEQAKLYMSLKDPINAERHAREALDLEPNYLPARGLLTGLYVEFQRINEANKELQEIQDRQLRYASWPKNQLEEAFLTVDVTPIRVALDRRLTSG